ncbi:MAG: hypothetical protein GPI92_23125 [Microcystis aeruginosa K13-06]|nr:hypothetical protein [Microcystis aeruginosa K13-06]
MRFGNRRPFYGGEDVKGHFHTAPLKLQLLDKNVIKRQKRVILPLQYDSELSREQ